MLPNAPTTTELSHGLQNLRHIIDKDVKLNGASHSKFQKGKPHRKLFTSYGIDTSDTPPNSKSASAFSNSAQNIDSPTKGHRRTKSVGTIGRNNPLKKKSVRKFP
jgi:hypothetical protein